MFSDQYPAPPSICNYLKVISFGLEGAQSHSSRVMVTRGTCCVRGPLLKRMQLVREKGL